LQPKTAAGLTEEEIGRLLVLDIKDADYFQEGGAPTSMAAEICLPGIPRSWAGCSHKDEIRHKPAHGLHWGRWWGWPAGPRGCAPPPNVEPG